MRKALQLYSKTNPSMLEWLNSPIRYIDDKTVTKKLLQLDELYGFAQLDQDLRWLTRVVDEHLRSQQRPLLGYKRKIA